MCISINILNISQHLASIQTEKIGKANKTEDGLASKLLWKIREEGQTRQIRVF